jgi:tetratricopeptide (TPR) repeat protein
MRTNCARVLCAFVIAIVATGCSGGLTGFILAQRNHQGDLALKNGNVKEALLEYRLAIAIDGQDAHARAGLAQAEVALALESFVLSKFDDASTELSIATKYDPGNVRAAELRAEVDQARVKREIVLSNYPTYKETGLELRKAYTQLHAQSSAIVLALNRFDYTYDSSELVKAIAASKLLGADVSKLTARLINYRQLVEAGSPEKAGAPLAPAASLLPLP